VLETTNDADVPIATTQTVNVGEHVRLKLRVAPSAAFTNAQWIITGAALKDWVTKDGEAVNLALNDYLSAEMHLSGRVSRRPRLPTLSMPRCSPVDRCSQPRRPSMWCAMRSRRSVRRRRCEPCLHPFGVSLPLRFPTFASPL
jgi:hypothetical protein